MKYSNILIAIASISVGLIIAKKIKLPIISTLRFKKPSKEEKAALEIHGVDIKKMQDEIFEYEINIAKKNI
ncbi:MAG: hypothetical protein M0R17_01335 [Candidatus Omnitrophica bacterium]|jgi:hypothetical protein|nr:hypothetical protein [Candidatus Omnitrophota bacterium]